MYKKQHVAYVILVGIIVGAFATSALTRDERDFSGGFNWSQLGQVVGVAGSVVPNEVNTFAQDLQLREQELDERERELADREQDLLVTGRDGATLDGTLLLATVGLLLLVLILLNFFLDWRRGKRKERI